MQSNDSGDKSNKENKDKVKKHLLNKRDELIWSLSSQQDYSPAEICKIFNIRHISTVTRIVARKPERWLSPWVKRGGVEVGMANG